MPFPTLLLLITCSIALFELCKEKLEVDKFPMAVRVLKEFRGLQGSQKYFQSLLTFKEELLVVFFSQRLRK